LKIIIILLVVIGAAVLGGAVYFRAVPDDPARWHVDPLTVVKPEAPNAALIRPEGGDSAAASYSLDPVELAEAIDEIALSEPRTKRIAGDPEELWMTYVQRSAVLGFPDYISVKVVPVDGGATWAAFSRSRFGSYDWGVNAKRLARWQEALATRLGG
jgi:uncharacterized protein (DUF1499 family)